MDNLMSDLRQSVALFKHSLSSFILKKEVFSIVDGLSYQQYCLQEAIFYLVEMERAAKTLLHLSLNDQKQIMFWAIQMRDEMQRILKNDFHTIYEMFLTDNETRVINAY